MTSAVRALALAVGLGGCVFLVDALHQEFRGLHESPASLSAVIPDGHVFGKFLLEQRTTAADLVFLKLIQAVGSGTDRHPTDWNEISRLAWLATDLDPLYGYAYEVAGIVLADPGGRYDLSDDILAKGIANAPGRWQLPFFAAFNRWYGRSDYAGAAPLLIQASRIEGAPPYLSGLAARLFTEAGEIETGIRLIEATLEQSLPPNAREQIEARRQDLLVERELRRIEEAAARFASRAGRRPVDLDELRAGEPLPLTPFPVAYDRIAGEATSPLLPKRIRLHHADAKPAPLVTETSP